MHRFIFNQEIALTQDQDSPIFEISIYITTSKGSHYITGVLQIDSHELNNLEGEVVTMPISKCIDPQGSCEMKVIQVNRHSNEPRIVIANTRPIY